MAIPSFVNIGTKITDGTAPFTQVVGFPASPLANDIYAIIAATDNTAGGSITIDSAGSVSTWTAITGSQIGVASGEKLWVWWGRYSSGTTGPTVTSSADHLIAAIIAYRGADTGSTPIDNQATGSEATSDTSFSFATGISTGTNNCLCLVIYTSGADSNTGQSAGTPANSSLASVTLRAEYNTNAGGGGGFVIVEGGLATAGSMGTWTDTMGANTPKAYLTLALKEAVVTSTTSSSSTSSTTTSSTTTSSTSTSTTTSSTTTSSTTTSSTTSSTTTSSTTTSSTTTSSTSTSTTTSPPTT